MTAEEMESAWWRLVYQCDTPTLSARAGEKISTTFSFQTWYQSKILLSLFQSGLGPVSNIPITIFNVIC